MELQGPPMTALRGLVLTVFDQERSGTVIALPLTGTIDQYGFYLIGNVTGAGKPRSRCSPSVLLSVHRLQASLAVFTRIFRPA